MLALTSCWLTDPLGDLSRPAGLEPTPDAPDAGSDGGDVPPFSAIQTGQRDTVSTPAGKWSFGSGTCGAPYDRGSNTLLDGKQAGSIGLCFVQLVAQTGTGQVYVQDGTGLWWRWNGVDQWTPEVTGDPRHPVPAPTLGDNLLTNPNFAAGLTGWGIATVSGACDDQTWCHHAFENTSPDPGGQSLHVTADDPHRWETDVYELVPVTKGDTYLVSVWTTGGEGDLHSQGDAPATMLIGVPPSAGWVQSMCTVVPVNPASSGLFFALWLDSSLNMTNAYFGRVDPNYPAPPCRPQN
jgi:hypothetical protein